VHYSCFSTISPCDTIQVWQTGTGRRPFRPWAFRPLPTPPPPKLVEIKSDKGRRDKSLVRKFGSARFSTDARSESPAPPPPHPRPTTVRFIGPGDKWRGTCFPTHLVFVVGLGGALRRKKKSRYLRDGGAQQKPALSYIRTHAV
jgi:hypothetical protein